MPFEPLLTAATSKNSSWLLAAHSAAISVRTCCRCGGRSVLLATSTARRGRSRSGLVGHAVKMRALLVRHVTLHT